MASPASSDEGEIRDSVLEKATTSLPQLDGSFVDRQDRNRSRYSKSNSPSPENSSTSRGRQSADRSRSPYSNRGPRGSKRARDDDHYDRHHTDPRRFRIHYEDHPMDGRRRVRSSYEDLDKGPSSSTDLRYDDRDRYIEKRARTRSRSPHWAPRGEYRRDHGGHGYQDRNRYRGYADSDKNSTYWYDDQSSRSSRNQSVSKRVDGQVPSDVTKREAKSTQGQSQLHNDLSVNGFNIKKPSDTLTKSPNEPEEQDELDEAALIEQRRKRREAIKAKYRGSATPMLVQALQLGDKSASATPGRNQGDDDVRSTRSVSPVASNIVTPKENSDPTSPNAFTISNDQDLANMNDSSAAITEDDGPSAADYDPTMDMREDKQRDDQRHNDKMSSGTYDDAITAANQDVQLPVSKSPIQLKVKNTRDDFDMFAEEDDDMFAEEPVEKTTSEKATSKVEEVSRAMPIPAAKELDIGMLDNWDDAEGYYKVILGELLNGRYHVQANLGRGMFSAVVRATDVTTKKLVAIKLIRNNETMRKAGLKEIEILQKLNEADPEDKKHMIRLERQFEHKGHLCMVFENLSINLREVLKKFGRDVGINLRAVRVYAQQIFLGLSLTKKCNILHADLKPDNILVNEGRNMLKICDLGSASDASDNEITPYLVSRFYRAPEIILGMPYDFAIDMWSVGCTLYELYTGKILFTGRTNNQMLRSIMDCRGKFPTKLLKRAQFAYMHFDEMANFRSVEQDKLTGKDTVKILNFVKPSRDLRARLLGGSKGLTDAEMKELNLFTDLLDRCLTLNPEKRCTPTEALRHPFISKATK